MKIPESPNSTAMAASDGVKAAMTIGIPTPIMEMAVTRAVFAFLARDCLDLFDSPDRAALRWCADAKCTRVFIDRSRGQRRRWCGMKGCGDRAKAAAYRRRQALPLG